MNLPQKVRHSLSLFDRWFESSGFYSNDPGDIWAFKYGIWAKRLFYRGRYKGAVAVSPLLLLMFLPFLHRRLIPSVCSPICLSHIGLRILLQNPNTLDAVSGRKINSLLNLLYQTRDKKTHGLGWGLPFAWPNNDGIIPAFSACMTQTPYVLDLMLQLEKVQQAQTLDKWIKRICDWAACGIKEITKAQGVASAYSTEDSRCVANANAYRCYMLAVGSSRYGEPFTTKYKQAISYVLGLQQGDGSWLYGEHDQDHFIDHYHTVFVLKNLLKCLRFQPELGIEEAIEKGRQYYFENLFDEHGLPKPFSLEHRFQLHLYDSYDFAESIGLLSETGWDNDLLDRVVDKGIDLFQTKLGWFHYRVFKILFLRNLPYLRYANTAFALALQKYLVYRQHCGS